MSKSDRASPAPTILIVEDDEVAATELQNTLVEAGYVAPRVASGDEALRTLKTTQPDLILMSLMLPDTDGLILCSTLTTRIAAPIIALTETRRTVDRALALESGAINCLTKPVDRVEVLAQVRQVVHSYVAVQSGSGQPRRRPF
jgi:two-component system response regulator MtrA